MINLASLSALHISNSSEGSIGSAKSNTHIFKGIAGEVLQLICVCTQLQMTKHRVQRWEFI